MKNNDKCSNIYNYNSHKNQTANKRIPDNLGFSDPSINLCQIKCQNCSGLNLNGDLNPSGRPSLIVVHIRIQRHTGALMLSVLLFHKSSRENSVLCCAVEDVLGHRTQNQHWLLSSYLQGHPCSFVHVGQEERDATRRVLGIV